MTDLALALKWLGRGERGEVEGEDAEADSERSDARATAPKPLAQRSSISRRLRGGAMKRLQCMSVHKNKFLDVEENVAEVRPGFGRIRVIFQKLQGGRQFIGLRRTGEGGDVEVGDP